jgi:acetyl-CoA C-acetyltransferase
MTPTVQRVAVLGGNRIPFARSNGPYATASNQDMLTAALDGLVSRFGLQGERVGEVVAGAVLKHSRDFNLAREAVLGSRLSPQTPAYDIQQACGTGLQAIIAAANKIALGQLDSAIAGGVDTTSDAPIGVNEGLRQVLLEFNRARSLGARLRAATKLRPTHVVPNIPRNAEPRTGMSMGEHAAITAKEWGIAREDQDELAAASHRNLAAAYERGFFDDLVTPYLGLTRDQNLRADTSVEKLAKLKPVFGDTMTAGNSTPLTDGASVYAVPRMLERAGLTLADFDFYEIHEAFASQVLATLAAWHRNGVGDIDRAKLNVNGSSLAAGHPFAATGGRIVATLSKLLNERGSGRGLVSICAAGGQGVAAILEKP